MTATVVYWPTKDVCSRKICSQLLSYYFEKYDAPVHPIAEEIVSEEQSEFHKDRSCTDTVSILKKIMEKREFSLPPYLFFLDYGQVYDR
jgi:hypothetical protein